MKITKKEISALILLVGVLALVFVYVWVYMPYNEKTMQLEAENASLNTKIAELEAWSNQIYQMQTDTESMIIDINQIFAKFPADSLSEDAIMYAVDLENDDAQTFIHSIGLGMSDLVYESAPTVVSLAGEEDMTEHVYQLYEQQITYQHDLSYDGMKRYVNTIVKDKNRRAIDTINLAYDNTSGILTGTTTMNLYTISGTSKEYQKTVIPHMNMGVNNIFQTIE